MFMLKRVKILLELMLKNIVNVYIEKRLFMLFLKIVEILLELILKRKINLLLMFMLKNIVNVVGKKS